MEVYRVCGQCVMDVVSRFLFANKKRNHAFCMISLISRLGLKIDHFIVIAILLRCFSHNILEHFSEMTLGGKVEIIRDG